jgi:hypothetical protein
LAHPTAGVTPSDDALAEDNETCCVCQKRFPGISIEQMQQHVRHCIDENTAANPEEDASPVLQEPPLTSILFSGVPGTILVGAFFVQGQDGYMLLGTSTGLFLLHIPPPGARSAPSLLQVKWELWREIEGERDRDRQNETDRVDPAHHLERRR